MTGTDNNTKGNTMELTKPAIEHTAEERRHIYRTLVTEFKSRLRMKGERRLSGQQVAWAKGQATKTMNELGF